MGKVAVLCLLIRSKSKRILDVMSKVVKKFQFCPAEESCNLEGGSWETECFMAVLL